MAIHETSIKYKAKSDPYVCSEKRDSHCDIKKLQYLIVLWDFGFISDYRSCIALFLMMIWYSQNNL